MKDELTELYESVRNPKKDEKAEKPDKKNPDKKGIVAGATNVDEDFGFNKKGVQKGTGPESVKNLTKPTLKEDAENTNMNEQPEGSSFDKLFARTITEEFGEDEGNDEYSHDNEMQSGFPSDSEDGMGPSDDADEEVSLKSRLGLLANELLEIIDQIEGGDDEGMEGEGEGEDEMEFGGDDGMDGGEQSNDIEGLQTASTSGPRRPMRPMRPFGEASGMSADTGGSKKRDGVIRNAPNGNTKTTYKNASLMGKNNKVSGYFGKDTSGGKADTGLSKPRDGVLRPCPDGKSSLQGKNNKVQGSSPASKQGASLFD